MHQKTWKDKSFERFKRAKAHRTKVFFTFGQWQNGLLGSNDVLRAICGCVILFLDQLI
jgi:hypothetical protein